MQSALPQVLIWGRPTWGTWWEWDGRLTSMLVLLFLYAGLYRADPGRQPREGGSSKIAAIFGLVGAVNVPIIKPQAWCGGTHSISRPASRWVKARSTLPICGRC